MSSFQQAKVQQQNIRYVHSSAKAILTAVIGKILKIKDSIMSQDQLSELPSCIAMVRMAVHKKLIEAQGTDQHDRADKPKSYIDLAGLHIEKLSSIALKKKKMRAQASHIGTQQQE